MNPDKLTDFEPSGPTAGDRMFSQMPTVDQWRLVKEALREAKLNRESHRAGYLRRWLMPTIPFTLACILGLVLRHYEILTRAFSLWISLHGLALFVLLGSWVNRDRRVYYLDSELANLEDIILSQGGPGERT